MAESNTPKASPILNYNDQKSFGVISGKNMVEIYPKYGGIFTGGDIVRLEIPSQAWMNPQDFFITFKTSIQAGANDIGVDPTASNVLPHMTLSSAAYSDQAMADPATYTRGDQSLRFVPGIQSIFNRVRLLAGSVVIEDIQNYNVLYRMMLEQMSNEEWRKTDGFHLEGWYDQGDRDQIIANHNFHAKNVGGTSVPTNQGHEYVVRPLLGLLLANKAIPLKYMGQLTIELYMEEAEECLWSSTVYDTDYVPIDGVEQFQNSAEARTNVVAATPGAGGFPPLIDAVYDPLNHPPIVATTATKILYPKGKYSISDVKMHVPFIYPMDSFDQQMMNAIEQGLLAIFFATWSTHTRQLASIGGRTTLSFQERATVLKGGYAVMRNSPEIRAIDSDMGFVANGIQSYQWKLGSEYIPAQEIRTNLGGGQALAHLKLSFHRFGNKEMTSLANEFNFLPRDLPSQLEVQNVHELRRGIGEPSKFVMALDLEKSPGQTSGFDSSASSVDVELLLDFATHASLVGTTTGAAGSKRHTGALAGTTFQPAKRRAVMEKPTAVGAVDQTPAMHYNSQAACQDDSATLIRSVNALNWETIPDNGRRHGVMIAKNTDYKFKFAAGPTDAPDADFTVTHNQLGEFTTVHFFAHLDASLKLTAVGRMEIVR